MRRNCKRAGTKSGRQSEQKNKAAFGTSDKFEIGQSEELTNDAHCGTIMVYKSNGARNGMKSVFTRILRLLLSSGNDFALPNHPLNSGKEAYECEIRGN